MLRLCILTLALTGLILPAHASEKIARHNDATLHDAESPLLSMGSYQAEGFSFHYPRGWKLSKNNECLTLKEPDTLTSEDYTLRLCVQHGTLEQAADKMIFYLEDGVWMRSAGMDPPSPVDLIEGPGWKSLRTTQTCGVSDEESGFHAAGGTCLMAIVDSTKTQLLFDTQGYYQDFDTTGVIIESVRFDEKK